MEVSDNAPHLQAAQRGAAAMAMGYSGTVSS